MNVKSRAQLIVWCLPHLGFVETETRNEQSIQAANNGAFGAGAQTQTIPAGSATVGGATPTIIPGRNNDIGNRGGNSDLGSMGM